MSEQLSGDALNRAIAEAMGWEQCRSHRPMCMGWYQEPHNRHVEHSRQKEPPDFITSLDVLSAGPERVLRAAGGRQSHSEGRSMNFQTWEWDCPDSGINTRDGWNACEKGRMDEPVRARAALAALNAVADPGGAAQAHGVPPAVSEEGTGG